MKIMRKKHLHKIICWYIINSWRRVMESMIIDREILPEPIFSYIHSEKIRIFEENGNRVVWKPQVSEQLPLKMWFCKAFA
jgi:hypothetical protein